MRMVLLAYLFAAVAACAGPLPPASDRSARPDAFDTLDAIREGRYRLSSNVSVLVPVGGSFDLGGVREDWDNAERYELDFLYHIPDARGFETQLGAYFFYEDRDWRAGSARFDYDALGFGVEPGAVFYLLDKQRGEAFNLGLRPYARLGFGWQDGVFSAIPSADGFSYGDVSGGRFVAGLGLDLQALFGDALLASVGVGGMIWDSENPRAETRDALNNVIEEDDRLDLHGKDAFVRFSIGIKF
jgi:hypothetical protein